MPRRISALRIGRDGRRVMVEFDGTESVPLTKAAAAGLHVGQTFAPPEIERLQHESRLQDAYARCLGLVARRPRSRAEIERYLRGRDLADAEREEVIARLTEREWINDREFARVWVENRQEFRPRSERALRMELRRFGVPEEETREALQGMDEGLSALSAARKKAARLLRSVGENPDARLAFQKKMTAYLASRGFNYELSRETARSVWAELSAEDEGGKQ
jgi:regulatory protein